MVVLVAFQRMNQMTVLSSRFLEKDETDIVKERIILPVSKIFLNGNTALAKRLKRIYGARVVTTVEGIDQVIQSLQSENVPSRELQLLQDAFELPAYIRNQGNRQHYPVGCPWVRYSW